MYCMLIVDMRTDDSTGATVSCKMLRGRSFMSGPCLSHSPDYSVLSFHF